MPNVPSFVPFIRWLLLASCVVCSASVASGQNGQMATCGPCTLTGIVSDATSHARLSGVRIQLNSTQGPSAGTVVSAGDGIFYFSNLPAASYILVADKDGYETLTQQVDLFNEELGFRIDLRKIADAGSPDKGPNTVTVRDLSIPHKARDRMQKGLALLYGKSDYQGSLKPFQDAIQAYPGYYEAYAQMGVAYMKLADTANSEKAFRKSAEVSHEHYQDAYLGLAELALDGHRFSEAAPLARKAIEIDSNSWRAQSQLARALIELHRASEAEPTAVAAVKLKPDNPTLYLLLANIHMQLQNDRAQLDDLNNYLRLAPTGPFAEQARQQREQLQQFLTASKSSSAASSTEPKP